MTEHKTLAAALAAFQAEVPHVGKNKTAQVRSDKGSYSYTYADLADVSAVALPALAKHGLSFSCKPTLDEDGNFVLAYTLRHAGSAETDCGTYPLPKSGTPQQIGSSISYGRRYVLSAVTGIVADEDDDGRAGGEATPATPQRRPQKPPPSKPVEGAANTTVEAAKTVLRNRAKAMGLDLDAVANEYEARAKTPLKDETRADWVEKFVAGLADGTIKIPAAAGAS